MKKNTSIELLRGICSVLVVLLHCPFPGEVGRYVTGLARFAVPFFLMVSGYFACRKDAAQYAVRKTKETLCIVAVLTVLYGALNSARSLYSSGSAIAWLLPYCNWQSIMELLVFNRAAFICSIMWYMLTLVYIYLLYALAAKTGATKYWIWLTPLLLAANLWISEYLGCPWYYVGNFILMGIPFFVLGYHLRQVKAERINLPTWIWGVGIAAGALLTIVEVNRNPDAYCYIGTLIMVVCAFVWCIRKEERKIPDVLVRFGGEYSAYIFYIHCAVIAVFNAVGLGGSGGWLAIVRPFAVLSVSVLGAYVLIVLKRFADRRAKERSRTAG